MEQGAPNGEVDYFLVMLFLGGDCNDIFSPWLHQVIAEEPQYCTSVEMLLLYVYLMNTNV
jgi:hypothetical protein